MSYDDNNYKGEPTIDNDSINNQKPPINFDQGYYSNPGGYYTPYGQPPRSYYAPKPRSRGRIAAFITLLCVCFLLVGAAVMYAASGRINAPEAQATPAPTVAQNVPGQTQTVEGNAPSATDKHFNLEEATRKASDGTNVALSVPQIAKKVGPAIVGITSEYTITGFRSGTQTSTGSGIIISEDGYIVTNNHVIEGADKVTVTLSDGTDFPATIVGTDPTSDIGVLKISAQNLKTAALGDSSTLEVGELAVVIGNPLGPELSGTVTVGVISALDRQIELEGGQTLTLLQTDASVNPGNSGGAIINSYGQVVGIITAKSLGFDVEGIGYAIPINNAKPIIQELINKGYVSGRPMIGIYPQDTIAYGVEGVLVAKLEPDGPADKAGVQVNDLIVGIDGQQVRSLSELNAIKNTYNVGDTITLNIIRNNKQIDIKVVLGEDVPRNS